MRIVVATEFEENLAVGALSPAYEQYHIVTGGETCQLLVAVAYLGANRVVDRDVAGMFQAGGFEGLIFARVSGCLGYFSRMAKVFGIVYNLDVLTTKILNS